MIEMTLPNTISDILDENNKIEEYSISTNYDHVKSFTTEEFSKWYWNMLKYVGGYTDSKVALENWLKKPYDPDSTFYKFYN